MKKWVLFLLSFSSLSAGIVEEFIFEDPPFASCHASTLAASAYGNAARSDGSLFSMTGAKRQVPLDLLYTKEDFALISQGLIPECMDDRWVIIVEDGHIFFYRSWTGIMIYDCSFIKRGDQIWIPSMYVNQNLHEYANTDDEHDIRIVKYFLDYLGRVIN